MELKDLRAKLALAPLRNATWSSIPAIHCTCVGSTHVLVHVWSVEFSRACCPASSHSVAAACNFTSKFNAVPCPRSRGGRPRPGTIWSNITWKV